MVQWVRLCAPNAGCRGSIPGQGTRSRMRATTKKSACATKKSACWLPRSPRAGRPHDAAGSGGAPPVEATTLLGTAGQFPEIWTSKATFIHKKKGFFHVEVKVSRVPRLLSAKEEDVSPIPAIGISPWAEVIHRTQDMAVTNMLFPQCLLIPCGILQGK